MATPVVEQVVAAFVARLEALDDIKVERERKARDSGLA